MYAVFLVGMPGSVLRFFSHARRSSLSYALSARSYFKALSGSRSGCAAEWVAEGKTNPEIGTILGISPHTVQKHLERAYKRLGVENRHAAMRMVLDAGS